MVSREYAVRTGWWTGIGRQQDRGGIWLQGVACSARDEETLVTAADLPGE